MDTEKLFRLLRGRKVWIQTHNFPDPDAIASAYGLLELLAHFQIEATVCYDGEIDKLSSTKMLRLLNFEMVSAEAIRGQMKEEDAIILVDCQKNSGNTTNLIGDEIAVIDHHTTFVEERYEYADIRITGACASLIADYYRELKVTPSSQAATALIYGMRMDTLQFSRGTTEFDVDMYSFLFPYCSNSLLRKLETNNMAFQDLKAYAAAIENIRVYGKTGYSHVDFLCPDALVAILSDFLLSLVEVEVVVLYAKRKGGYKFSFRSERSDIHAGELANRGLSEIGNGGGHSFMAGGFVPSEKLRELGIKEDHFYDYIQSRFSEILKEMEAGRRTKKEQGYEM